MTLVLLFVAVFVGLVLIQKAMRAVYWEAQSESWAIGADIHNEFIAGCYGDEEPDYPVWYEPVILRMAIHNLCVDLWNVAILNPIYRLRHFGR